MLAKYKSHPVVLIFTAEPQCKHLGQILKLAPIIIFSPSFDKECVCVSVSQGALLSFFTAFQGHLREIVFDPVIFNQMLVNRGRGYDNSTRVFMAPVAGIFCVRRAAVSFI